ncbi:putative cytochrome P450 oxidoreductase [Pyrenochaeta sp. DS3sAY3a]|nr:putative cytochrome P450 oxidoreductase [Pyrenochaeta sp. DS3sAY3a]
METRACIIAFLVGVVLEVVVFSRNEWDRRAPRAAFAFCLLFATVFVIFKTLYSHTYYEAMLESSILGFILLSGLFSSILAYRLFFHPLKRIPGPLAARVTALWVVKENIPDLLFYKKLRTLHERYGDFVRIRPREISICHPDAVVDVHGPRNKILKGEFYEQNYPFNSLQLTRDTNYHKSQRRFWDKAFHTKALQEYTPRLVKHYKILLGILDTHETSGTSINASQSFMDLFFDVVSDLTFGKSFDSLTTKQRNPIIGEFLNQQRAIGFMLLNMWLFYFIRCIPLVQSMIKDWLKWYGDALDARKKMESISPDFYTYLSQSNEWEANGIHEAQLAIIAGADTNAITVSNICFLLCRHPEYQAKLYAELADLPAAEGIVDDQHLVGIPLLLGIINESLRLHPPVPTGVQRVTPPEGATIAGRFIPGEMVVTTPTYSLHRALDPRAFVDPDAFIPERWTTKPELVIRKDAFIAFGYGTYNCAGKPLAMMQLRMVVAMVIKRYELSFPLGQEAECERFIEDQADCFTIHLEPLPLKLTRRMKV